MIKVSDKALDIMRTQGGGNALVKITVKTGGCAGMKYDAEIVSKRSKSDTSVFHKNGIEIITDNNSLSFLEGLHIDYSDDLISAGLRFNNTSSESSCGCGASFAVSGFPQSLNLNKGCAL